MSSLIYDDWTWSYSRLSLFNQCPYAFALKYLYGETSQSNQYAEFGSYIHSIHEQFYNKELKESELVPYYIEHFSEVNSRMSGEAKSKYFLDGLNYFEGGIRVVPSSIIGVEKVINFKVANYRFVGIIDLLYRNEDGSLTILDHKSHNLKPRSGRAKPTATDRELDDYLKQLYLYAHGVHQLGLGNVSTLTFNCFRGSQIIENRYSEAKEDEAVEWAVNTIRKIEDATVFEPRPDWFYCRNLCDCRGICEYK